MSYTTLDYLRDTCHWEYRQIGPNFQGRCTIHSEHTGSLTVYRYDQRTGREDWHWKCFGCQRGGDLARMVLCVEFGDNPTYWSEAFARVKALGGEVTTLSSSSSWKKPTILHREKVPPTPMQRQALSALMDWWHQCLWSPYESCHGARYYLCVERGVDVETLRQPQLGYAPPASEGWVLHEMSSFFLRRLGEHWYTRLKDLGIFYPGGHLRVQDRVMFTCTNLAGEPVFYQGRMLPGSRNKAKYLNPPGLSKVAFTLPITSPSFPGTVVVESPLGPAVGHQYAIPVAATLGQDSLSYASLGGSSRPFWMAHDNDGAGELQARAFARCAKEEGWSAFRVVPPRLQKGFDEWLRDCGPIPFFQAVTAHLEGEAEGKASNFPVNSVY